MTKPQTDIFFSEESERAVLGAMMQNVECIPSIVEQLGTQETVFYKVPHQLIYKAILVLFNEHGKVDPLLVAERITAEGNLGRIGGETETYDIQQSSPSWENAEHYGEIVRLKSIRRNMADVGKRLSGASQDADLETEADLILKADDIYANLITHRREEVEDAYEQMGEIVDEITSRQYPKLSMASGFPEIDELTAGFQEGEMFVLAGRPSMGKTTLALQIARRLAVEAFVPVAVYSYEMRSQDILNRLLARETGISFHRLLQDVLTPPEQERLNQAREVYKNRPLFIFDKRFNIYELASHVRYMKSRFDIRMIVVDYLQIVPARAWNISEVDKITEHSGMLKAIARDNSLCSLVVSQLSRASEKRQNPRPKLSDLRSSGAIEQDADKVAFIHRPGLFDDEEGGKDYTLFLLDKNRNGPIGQVELSFSGGTFEFR